MRKTIKDTYENLEGGFKSFLLSIACAFLALIAHSMELTYKTTVQIPKSVLRHAQEETLELSEYLLSWIGQESGLRVGRMPKLYYSECVGDSIACRFFVKPVHDMYETVHDYVETHGAIALFFLCATVLLCLFAISFLTSAICFYYPPLRAAFELIQETMRTILGLMRGLFRNPAQQIMNNVPPPAPQIMNKVPPPAPQIMNKVPPPAPQIMNRIPPPAPQIMNRVPPPVSSTHRPQLIRDALDSSIEELMSNLDQLEDVKKRAVPQTEDPFEALRRKRKIKIKKEEEDE